MYKQDLTLNDLEGLICYKNQPTCICMCVYIYIYVCGGVECFAILTLKDVFHIHYFRFEIWSLHLSITMTSEAVIQRRNLESEVLFLRQEHAKTLKGLHEEIKVLQKRCTGKSLKKSKKFNYEILWALQLTIYCR